MFIIFLNLKILKTNLFFIKIKLIIKKKCQKSNQRLKEAKKYLRQN